MLNIENTTINCSTYIFLLELKGERPIIYPRSHYSQHGDRECIPLIFTLKVSTRFRCSETRVPGHVTKLELEPLRNQYRLVTTLRYIRHILTRFDQINVGINKKWRRCSRTIAQNVWRVTSIEISKDRNWKRIVSNEIQLKYPSWKKILRREICCKSSISSVKMKFISQQLVLYQTS